MEEPNQGLQQATETIQTELPQQDGTTQNPTQSPQQSNNPEALKLQELESRLQAETKRAEDFQQLARQQQSRASQLQTQVQALAGTTPQADPLEAKASAYAKQFNLNPDDARAVVSMIQAEVAPFQQRYQQQTQALQATSMIGDVLNAAIQQDPSLFNDQVYAEVQNQLRQEALQGANYITPEYALDHAAIVQSRMARANRGNPQSQQYQQPQRQQQYPAPSHQQSIPSMMNQGSGFRAQMPVPQAKANAPLVDKIANDMQAYWDPNYKPSTPQQH